MLHYPCTSRPGCWRSHGAWGCPCPGASWTLVLNDCPIEAPSQEWVSECVLLLFILNWHQDERHCLWKAEAERHCLSAAAAPMAPLPAPLNPIGPYIHCTMRLSIELENFQILKSKGLVFAQFWSKYDNSSDDWSKTGQNLKEKYSHHIFVQN